MYYTTNYCKTTSGHFNVTLVNEGMPIKPHNDKINNGIRKLTRQKKGAPTAMKNPKEIVSSFFQRD